MSDQGDRLRQARADAGFDGPGEAAARFGWNVNTYKSNENGNATFSFKRAKEYAAAFGVRPEWLYAASGPPSAELGFAESPAPRFSMPGDPVSLAELRAYLTIKADSPPVTAAKGKRVDRRIPVVGEVAAGLWREAPVLHIEEVDEWLPMDVQGYERAVLRAFKVSGPSMNLVYPEGRFVITAHPAEAAIREGDYVVVERSKADLVEITLKEFVREPDGRIALWPRSTHPDFQTPIYLKSGEDDHTQVGLTIIGVVVGDFNKRVRPPISYERAP